MVSKLARADGEIVKCDSITVGGNTLGQILSTREFNIKQALQNKKYDYIIIQEASSSNYQESDNFLLSATEFKKLADENNAELILYQTWAYDREPGYREYQQEMIIDAYIRVSQALGVRTNIAGEVFYQFSLKYPEINLYYDLNHSSLAGSYLASCVHYVSLFKTDIIDNVFNSDLDEDVAFKIRNYVNNYLLAN